MRGVLFPIGVSLVAALCLWGALGGDAYDPVVALDPVAGCPTVPVTSCKPEAPIAVTLVQVGEPSGNQVRAVFSVRPVLELTQLSWKWELSRDVSVAEGEASGSAAPERGVLTEGEVRLHLPNDGRHHTAKLVVTGALRVADGADADADADADANGPEWVSVVRTLSWGQPDPVVLTVLSPDADSGLLVPVGVVPATHVPAAQAPRGAQR